MDKKLLKTYIFRLIFQIFAVLSIGVLIWYVCGSLSAYFLGFGLFYNVYYGWEAVYGTFLLLGYLLWPLLLACVVIILATIIYFNKTKGKYDKEERKIYLKYIGKSLVKPAIAIVILAVAAVGGLYFFTSTYTGAKVLVNAGLENMASHTYTLKYFFDMDEVNFVWKNDELIYAMGMFGEGENLDFLDDLYYSAPDAKGGFREPDLSGADEYIFLDRDGINEGALLVKGNCVAYYSSFYDMQERKECDYFLVLMKEK